MLKDLLTVLYYTSNRENEVFEEKIRQKLLEAMGDLPLISISQKPIDFGKNICVGDVGTSGFNMFRQVLIGCKAAITPFVISAESDCLYPPDYFTFVPPRDNVPYRNSNLYVMPDRRPFFFHKEEGATHSQVVGREFYIERLETLFKDAPEWNVAEKNFPKERHHRSDVFNEIEHFKTENPVFQIKTHKGMRYYTRSERTPIHELPYWGRGIDIYNYYVRGS